jgi:hypothetical protein
MTAVSRPKVTGELHHQMTSQLTASALAIYNENSAMRDLPID